MSTVKVTWLLTSARGSAVAQVSPGGAVRFLAVKFDEADAAREALARRVSELIERILWEFGDDDD